MINVDQQINAVRAGRRQPNAGCGRGPNRRPSRRPTTPPSTTSGMPAPTRNESPAGSCRSPATCGSAATTNSRATPAAPSKRCEPPTGFGATWEFGGDVSWIEVRLATTPDGTAAHARTHRARRRRTWAEYGPGAVGVGWDLTVLGLALHLAVGRRRRPGRTPMAWSASDEGREFMTPEQCALAGRQHRGRHRPGAGHGRRRTHHGVLHRRTGPDATAT